MCIYWKVFIMWFLIGWYKNETNHSHRAFSPETKFETNVLDYLVSELEKKSKLKKYKQTTTLF